MAKVRSSSDVAREIMEYQENRDKPGKGFNGVFGRLKRKQYTMMQADLAAIIDGTYVAPEPVDEIDVEEEAAE